MMQSRSTEILPARGDSAGEIGSKGLERPRRFRRQSAAAALSPFSENNQIRLDIPRRDDPFLLGSRGRLFATVDSC